MEESLDQRIEAAASEGLDYLRNALRTGAYDAELLKTAQFLVGAHLSHDHDHGEEEDQPFMFSSFAGDDEDE